MIKRCVWMGLLVLGTAACSSGNGDLDAGTTAPGESNGRVDGGGGAGGDVGDEGGSRGADAGGDDGDGTGARDGDGGDRGDGDAGGDGDNETELEWEPLTTTATPSCMHGPVPDGFVPALMGAFTAGGDRYRIFAVSVDGEAVELNCAEQSPDQQSLPSPDRRKLRIRVDGESFVTSWLVDGVFALPVEFDGLALSGYRWMTDDYLVASGTRVDEASNDVLERALVAVRWDGTGARRLSGEAAADSDPEFLGGTSSYAMYRLKSPDEAPGYAYYRVDAPDLSSMLLTSGIGGGWVSVFGALSAQTAQLLVAGDGMGIDYLFAVDVETGAVRSLEAAVIATQAFVTPDGAYVFWRRSTGWSGRALLPGDEGRFTYEGLDRNALLTFQPDGHVLATRTAQGGLAIADPGKNTFDIVQHEAVQDGATGVRGMMVSGDGENVFFRASFAPDAPAATYLAKVESPAGPVTQLSAAGRETGFFDRAVAQSHLVFSDGQALVLADGDGNVTQIPGTDGTVSGGALGWSHADARVLLYAHDGERGRLSLWTLGEPGVTSLPNSDQGDLGEVSAGWTHSLLR